MAYQKLVNFFFKQIGLASDEVYDMMSLVVRALRECINKIGYTFVGIFEDQNGGQKSDLNIKNSNGEDENYCEIETCQYISIVFDYFVKEYLPDYIETDEFQVDFVCKF